MKCFVLVPGISRLWNNLLAYELAVLTGSSPSIKSSKLCMLDLLLGKDLMFCIYIRICLFMIVQWYVENLINVAIGTMLIPYDCAARRTTSGCEYCIKFIRS